MSASPSNAPSLISNLAALVVIVLAGAFAIDYLAGLFGVRLGFVCAVFQPVVILAQTAGMALGTVGAIVFVLSGFSRFEWLLGALILGVLPGVFLHYLGAGCPA